MTRMRLVATGLVLAAVLALPAPGVAQAARGLSIGFLDGVYMTDERDRWLQRTVDASADIVRLDIGWPAPDTATRPVAFDARNPADPGYDFSRADAAIRAASARNLRILVSFTGAPRWAEGPGRPEDAVAGSWRPDPVAVGDYGAALAGRYSGSFPDPQQPGRTLPAVAAYQVWNEPNLGRYLSPQWVRGSSVAPILYRAMLNAFYRGVKSVRPEALVVTAGTAPFGDPPGSGRTMPAAFVRALLCLRRDSGRLRRAICAAPASFDVLSHHPYSVGSPRRRALNDDDVSIPDIGKLTRLLRAAESRHTALPAEHHRMWVTEVAYDSRGPDPEGVPLGAHARYLEQTLFELWRQGVDTITWFQIRDQAPSPDYASTNQSGILFGDGRPKPAEHAFRFPLVAARARSGGLLVWGRAPVAGTARIEVTAGSGWRTVRTLTVAAHGVFQARLRTTSSRVRARVGADASLTWTLH